MTENYLIFTEQPWIFGDLLTTIYKHVIRGESLGSTMDWEEDAPLLFHVVKKTTGEIHPVRYEADSMGFYHVINAYEEDDYLLLDAPFKASPVSYNLFRISKISSPPEQLSNYMTEQGRTAGFTRRFAIPLNVEQYTGDISTIKSPGESKAWLVSNSTVYLHPEYLAPPYQYRTQRQLEFAMVNPNFTGKKYRYAYGVGFPTGYFAGSIIKLDVVKKDFVSIWDDPACRATEPQFIPRPGSEQEQDGVVVFVCLGVDKENPTTYFVVLNPDMQELGRFHIPFATPVAFHGIWLQ